MKNSVVVTTGGLGTIVSVITQGPQGPGGVDPRYDALEARVAALEAATVALSDLTDVLLSSPNNGDTLTYNGVKWINTEAYSVGP